MSIKPEKFEGLSPEDRNKVKEKVFEYVLGDQATKKRIRTEADNNLRRSLRGLGMAEAEINAHIADIPNFAREAEKNLPPKGKVLLARVRRLSHQAEKSKPEGKVQKKK